jgi:hypothetical protein
VDINKIIARAKAILLSPKTEWPVIAGESSSTAQIYKDYVIWLAGVAAVATFVSMSVVGTRMAFLGTYRVGLVSGIGYALWSFLMSLVGVFLFGLLIDALAPKFGAQKDSLQALKTAAYTATAGWVGAVLGILPGVGGVLSVVAALYAIYLLYLGLPHTMKCPQDKAVAYTAVTIVVALIVGWLVSMATGSLMMRGGMGPFGSHTAIEQDGGFDADSPGGKLEKWAKGMEEAGKKIEQAEKSGDTDAAVAAAQQMLGAALGGGEGKVEALAPDRIKALLPASLGPLARSEISAERNAAMGLQISQAQARYGDVDQSIELQIQDMGGASGLMALASWASVEQERETGTGYEKTYKSGGRMIHEEWDGTTRRGEYAVIVGERFSVKASGSVAGIDVLKQAVGRVDLGALEALRGSGVSAQ